MQNGQATLPDFMTNPNAVMDDNVAWRDNGPPRHSATRQKYLRGISDTSNFWTIMYLNYFFCLPTSWNRKFSPFYFKLLQLLNESIEQHSTAERSNIWPAGSLEDLVTNLITNWKKETSHKARLEDWRTVNADTYRFSCNGGRPHTAEEMMEQGSTNALIQVIFLAIFIDCIWIAYRLLLPA